MRMAHAPRSLPPGELPFGVSVLFRRQLDEKPLALIGEGHERCACAVIPDPASESVNAANRRAFLQLLEINHRLVLVCSHGQAGNRPKPGKTYSNHNCKSGFRSF